MSARRLARSVPGRGPDGGAVSAITSPSAATRAASSSIHAARKSHQQDEEAAASNLHSESPATIAGAAP